MNEKELKKYVDEYFEKYMCVSFDKFIENWEETNETIHFFEKENKDLQQRIDKAVNDLNTIIDIIKSQPTENDNWLLERLEANKSILQGKE